MEPIREQDLKTSLVNVLLHKIPAEAGITRIEYEGPRIALYTKNPGFFELNDQIVPDLVNSMKKRIIVRTEPSILKDEEDARPIINDLIPSELGLKNLFFDGALSEVTAALEHPHLIDKLPDFKPVNILEKTGWRLILRKSSHISSSRLNTIYQTYKSSEDERRKFLSEAGEKIFRSKVSLAPEITIHTLGSFKEVGRSSMLITTPESKVLLDCGIHPGGKSSQDSYPRLDWANISLDELDAVVISHAHMDHQAFLPALIKYGYDGPIYCSEPTLPLMTLLQTDFIKVASVEGRQQIYDNRDIRNEIKQTIVLPYGVVTDVSPDIKIVLNNSGHILGSSTVHLHIGDGSHNIVYTGDYKNERTMLLDSTTWSYPRVETLITESTYGAKEDIMPNRFEVEKNFVNMINSTLTSGGKVLIPVPAVGRAQEMMLVIDRYMKSGQLLESPVFIEGMISEATAIHVSYPEYLSRELRSRILSEGEDPFLSDYFTIVDHPSSRDEALIDGPAIIMATSGMLEGGPVLEYFRQIAPSEKNRMIFVSYQIPGTLGRRVLDGSSQVSISEDGGRVKILDVNCEVNRIEGFSGHSDYDQIMRFIGKLRPKLKQVLVNHGERRKTENLANSISRMFRIPAYSPNVHESLRLL